jgi:hypothetical protein
LTFDAADDSIVVAVHRFLRPLSATVHVSEGAASIVEAAPVGFALMNHRAGAFAPFDRDGLLRIPAKPGAVTGVRAFRSDE